MPIEHHADPADHKLWTPAQSEYSLENLRSTPERTCEVSDDARNQLEQWNVSPEAIDQLARLSAKYEYANCPERAAEIAARGGIITTDLEGKANVLMPDFADLGNRNGGQCGEITCKGMRDLHSEGWFGTVNEANRAAGYPELTHYLIYGQSRTHFTHPAAVHVWGGIAPTGAELKNIVAVDVSLLEISSHHSNGYRPNTVIGSPSSVTMSRYGETSLGTLANHDGAWAWKPPRGTMLGITEDRALTIGIGFARELTSPGEPIIPAVQLTAADGRTGVNIMRAQSGEEVRGGALEILHPDHYAEATAVLNALSKTPFSNDEKLGQTHQDEKIGIKFY